MTQADYKAYCEAFVFTTADLAPTQPHKMDVDGYDVPCGHNWWPDGSATRVESVAWHCHGYWWDSLVRRNREWGNSPISRPRSIRR